MNYRTALAQKFMRKLAEHDPEGEHFSPDIDEMPPQTTFDEPTEMEGNTLESKIEALVEQLEDGLIDKKEFGQALDHLLEGVSLPPTTAWAMGRFIKKMAAISAPVQSVSGIPTQMIQQVIDNSMMGIARMDPNASWKVNSIQPSDVGYSINLAYNSKVPEQQIRQILNQVLSMQWPSVIFDLEIGQLPKSTQA